LEDRPYVSLFFGYQCTEVSFTVSYSIQEILRLALALGTLAFVHRFLSMLRIPTTSPPPSARTCGRSGEIEELYQFGSQRCPRRNLSCKYENIDNMLPLFTALVYCSLWCYCYVYRLLLHHFSLKWAQMLFAL